MSMIERSRRTLTAAVPAALLALAAAAPAVADTHAPAAAANFIALPGNAPGASRTLDAWIPDLGTATHSSGSALLITAPDPTFAPAPCYWTGYWTWRWVAGHWVATWTWVWVSDGGTWVPIP